MEIWYEISVEELTTMLSAWGGSMGMDIVICDEEMVELGRNRSNGERRRNKDKKIYKFCDLYHVYK